MDHEADMDAHEMNRCRKRARSAAMARCYSQRRHPAAGADDAVPLRAAGVSARPARRVVGPLAHQSLESGN